MEALDPTATRQAVCDHVIHLAPPRLYRFVDDAVSDAMILYGVLAQYGVRIVDSAAAILDTKRTLGSEDWTHEAECRFWHGYSALAEQFNAHPELSGIRRAVLARNRPSGWIADFFATPWRYALRSLYFLGFVVALVHWVDAKLLCDRIDGVQQEVIACLSVAREPTGAGFAGAAPLQPEQVAARRAQAREATMPCNPAIHLLDSLLARTDCVRQFGCWWWLWSQPQRDPRILNDDEAALWALHVDMVQERTVRSLLPAMALGHHVQAFAIYLLPFLFGSLGAYVSSIYRQLRRPWLEIFPNRVTLRRRLILVFCGGIFGALVGWLMSQVTIVPSLPQSFGPLFGAFAAGFNTRPVVKWIDALSDRLGSWAETAGEVAARAHPAPARLAVAAGADHAVTGPRAEELEALPAPRRPYPD